MKLFLFTAFFVFLFAGGYESAHAAVRSVEVSHSSATELEFTVSFTSLSELTRIDRSDSTVSYVKTVQVGMPPGASARLISAEGLGSADFELPANTSALPLVELSTARVVRGRQLLAAQLCPVTESGAFDSIRVRIAFSGGSTLSSSARPDPVFDRVLASSVVNFERSSSWFLPTPDASKIAAADFNPFAVSSNWVKMAVRQGGLYKLTGANIEAAGISIANLRSDSIRIFNGGGMPNPMDNDEPRPEFTEVALLVEDGGDGLFGQQDVLYFYGEATNRWIYAAEEVPSWLNNVYTADNVYWLTIASGGFSGMPVRMATVNAAPTGAHDTVITTYHRRVHAEQENLLHVDANGHLNDYYNWYWSTETQIDLFVPTPGIVAGDSAQLFIAARPGTFAQISVSINGTAGLNPVISGTGWRFGTKTLVDGMNNVQARLVASSTRVPPYFDYLEVRYLSRMVPASGQLDITLEGATGRALLQVQDNFGSVPLVMDLADPLHPVLLTSSARSGGQLSFESDLELGGINRFYCAVTSVALAPASLQKVTPLALRGESAQADLLIVTPQAFVSALEQYVEFRQADGYAVKTVPVEEIYNNFSWGLFDPTAIRDYLKFAYETYPGPAPAAVLFVGDANYDMMNRLKTNVPSYVPSYINPMESGLVGSSYGDDNYVYFGDYGILDSDHSFLVPDRGFDMMAARWPVRSRNEIATVISKIQMYESSTDFGLWRTVVTLVADDEFGAFSSETFHTTQTEELQRTYLPSYFIRNKIYAWDYPFVNSEKPAVNEAIVRAFNSGTLMVNYVGHGNPDVWGHEHFFTRTGDLPKLHNADRLPLVFAASCAIGFFDDPLRQAMGEDLLKMSSGGAMGVISAMRLVFSSDNAAFNRQVFSLMMWDDSLTICQAIYAAKLIRQYAGDTIPRPSDNDRSYVFFGDPLQKLGKPKHRIEYSEAPDSLLALGRSRVVGRVVDGTGAPVARDGQLLINVYDSDREKTYRLVNGGQVTQEVKYKLTGPTLFRGATTITNGAFDVEFIVPLDVSYGRSDAKILTYAILDTVDAIGLEDSLHVSNQVASVSDSAGPAIGLTITSRPNFVSGDLVSAGDSLVLRITDSSGINLAGGLGHGITLMIDNRPEQTVDLTGLFSYEQNSFTSGTLSYPLEELGTGERHLKVKAWDNANNSASAELTVQVATQGPLAVHDLMNYPNPMNNATTFYFELTQDVTQMTLDIFTLSGRKIRSLNGLSLDAGYYDSGRSPFIWDGRDTDGDRVATGVYVYKCTAVPRMGGESVESYGKVVVIN